MNTSPELVVERFVRFFESGEKPILPRTTQSGIGKRIIDFLKSHGPTKCDQIAKNLGVEKKSVSNKCWDMEKKGQVKKFGKGIYGVNS
jgi:Mn-dependent DtxR family transcriptional regulator